MKISVAMCTYNGEKYIKEQLESIIHQTRKVDEIVISDDGSKDTTLAICKEVLSTSSIPYNIVQNLTPLKVVGNFKQAFSLCSNDIIFSCDQDDIWEKNKVETILDVFEKNSEVDMVASDATLIDGVNNEMKMSLREGLDFSMNTKDDVLPSLLRTYCITGATMAFRKSFEEKYFYVSKYWLHDGWLALQASINNRFYYCNEKLTRYRLHGNNECGVGDVDILKDKDIYTLRDVRKRKAKKMAYRFPFYFEDLAKEKKMMYLEVLEYHKKMGSINDNNNIKLLEECIYFWEERSNIRNKTYKQVKSMIHFFEGNNSYSRFCESVHFNRYDLYFYYFYKLIPRRKKESYDKN